MLGNSHEKLGNVKKARDYYDQSLKLIQEIKLP